MPSFPSWVAVVCTNQAVSSGSGSSPFYASERAWNLDLTEGGVPPPPIAVDGGKAAAPPPPPAVTGGSPKSALVTKAQAVADGQHSATRAAVARMARDKLAGLQSAPSAGRRLAQSSSAYSSSSTSSDAGVYYSEVWGACDSFTASNTDSAMTGTWTCPLYAPRVDPNSLGVGVDFQSCWLYVQTCGCSGGASPRARRASFSLR